MRFAVLIFCWIAFFGWDLAANDGQFVLAIGTRLMHLIRMTGLI
ncbi:MULTISPECIES: hypothetical protein [unclassified Mesorhizobium]|nr:MULTISPECIES: hypothetical protein [unclassified Mesorhizobium]